MNLKYRTRGMNDPKGKPKVYFSCHPEDFEEAFPLISEDLLNHLNCAVWYDADPAGTSGTQEESTAGSRTGGSYGSAEAELEDILKEMQLIVFGVTSKFIHESSRAKDLELPLALKNHIPVLPVMLENGLENEFSSSCAKIQVVPKYGTDPTALPYDEVLKTFLDSVLVGDELAEQVRSAFEAYVFLSYRKKDRKHAQRLMRLIHENRQFRDIAIWYDEFLVPGEGFNEAIRDAFQKSSLFAMAVTPHLEEDDNYVMRVEYPMARDRRNESDDFEIIPVEMYGPEDGEEGKDWRIDQSRLKGKEGFKYQEISGLQDEHRPLEMNRSFLDALTRIARKENDGSARHRYFIGLAYLNGIDVEIDQERALELIISAAEDPSPLMEATAKLADMYLNGEGVERDAGKALAWQEKLASQYKAAYDENHDPDAHKGYGTAYFKALRKLSDMYRDSGDMRLAMDRAASALAFCEELEQEVGIREQTRDKALILNRLGSLCRDMGELDKAQDCFARACGLYEKQAFEIGTKRARRDLSIAFERLGDICRKRDGLSEAEGYYNKAKEIREQIAEEEMAADNRLSAGTRRDCSAILTKLGNVWRSRKEYGKAGSCYTEALLIDSVLAEEVRSPQAFDDYGVSLVKAGDIRTAEGRLEEAETHYEKAAGIFRRNTEKTGSLFYQDHLAGGLGRLAGAKKKLGKAQEAEALYKETVELRQQLYEKEKTVSAAHMLAAACYNAAVFLNDGELKRRAYELWDELTAGSTSFSISKGSVDEEMSMFRASMEDAAKALEDGIEPETISNERIQKGNKILETYEVTSDAIHGGMGSVWRVHHRNWNVDLAMKRPQPKFFAEGSGKRKAEFVAECENWIRLGLHPNIVSCYYVRDISGVPSIFSEWMDGGSLKDCIRDGSVYAGTGAEAEERLLGIAIQFANGLQYAHEAGLMHQDVKPDNLLLNKDGEAKVADFGLAQARARLADVKAETDAPSRDDEAVISSGYTPAYCSPEQKDGKKVSRSTDIYSWAVSVLELFLGGRPWKSGAEVAQEFDSYTGKARIPLPQALTDLLGQCLRPDPEERPQSFAFVKAELQRIYKDRTGMEPAGTETGKAVSTADSLNNRALSYLDLGRPEEAEKCWKEALKQNGGHAESVYNRALMQWRSARISDLDVLTSLESCTRDPNCARLKSKIELERGNPEGVTDGADQPDILKAAELPVMDELTDKTGDYVYRDFLVAPDGSMMLGRQKIDEKDMKEEDEEWNLDLFLPPGRMKFHIPFQSNAGIRSHAAVDWAAGTQCVLVRSRRGTYELRTEDLKTGKKLDSVAVTEAFHPAFFSRDGAYLFTKEKAVLDMRNGKVIKKLQDIPVLLSPDGRIFAARYDRPDKTYTPVVIYDTAAMEPLRIMKGSGFVDGVLYSGTEELKTDLAFSPDGRQLFTGDERFIRALDTETGKETIIADDLDGFPFRIAVSPDGKLVAATQRRGILIVEISSGRHLRTIRLGRPSAVAFFGDRITASQTGSGTAPESCFVSVNTPVFGYRADWALSRIRTTKQQIETERRFASGLAKVRESYEKGEYREALGMLDQVRQLDGMANDPRALSLNRDIGANGTRISLESIDIARELSFEKHKCSRIAFSGDGSRMLCHCDYRAFVVETGSGNILSSFSGSGFSHLVTECNDFAIDHSGKNVLFRGNCLYNAETGEIRNTLKGAGESFYAARFTPDDRLVAVACKDETLRIYRTEDGELEAEIVIGPLPVYDLAFMPDGDILLANAHEDREIEMISIPGKKIVNLMETPDFYGKTCVEGGGRFPVVKTVPGNVQVLFRRINVSPDGKTILLEGDDFRCLTMDYDTHRMADGAADPPVIRRAVYTGLDSQVLRVEGELEVLHAGSITGGRWRVRDTKVSVSRSLKAEDELVLRHDRNGLRDVAVSPNGRYVGIVPDDGSILLYEINWKYEIRAAKKGMMGSLFRAFFGSKGKR